MPKYKIAENSGEKRLRKEGIVAIISLTVVCGFFPPSVIPAGGGFASKKKKRARVKTLQTLQKLFKLQDKWETWTIYQKILMLPYQRGVLNDHIQLTEPHGPGFSVDTVNIKGSPSQPRMVLHFCCHTTAPMPAPQCFAGPPVLFYTTYSPQPARKTQVNCCCCTLLSVPYEDTSPTCRRYHRHHQHPTT